MKTELKELTIKDLIEIQGGEITKDTSFAYDFFYIIGAIAKKVFTESDSGYVGGYAYGKCG